MQVTFSIHSICLALEYGAEVAGPRPPRLSIMHHIKKTAQSLLINCIRNRHLYSAEGFPPCTPAHLHTGPSLGLLWCGPSGASEAALGCPSENKINTEQGLRLGALVDRCTCAARPGVVECGDCLLCLCYVSSLSVTSLPPDTK